ncbi:MAG: glycosyltransferase family 2 protein [Burkholderiaceae bacterium]|nr:glycosyltransferase family 2 protein [Burkholderiaceae bacterium]
MFSIVVPLYNKKPYVGRCVESILKQSFRDFELIVVDDGSSDGGLLELVNISDPRLILLQQKNAGVGIARNSGIEKAKHEWVAFIDADDVWLENHLEELNKIINSYPDSGLVATSHVEYFDGGKMPVVDNEGSNVYNCDYFQEAIKKIGIVWTSATAVNRSAVNAVGGFKNFRLGEDLELWARLALHYPVAISSKVTAIYYRGTGGLMDTLSIEKDKNINKIQLDKISPSVSLLVDFMNNTKYLSKRNSIVGYINSRIYSSIRGALYCGNVSDTKLYGELLLSPMVLKFRLLKCVLLLPSFVINAMLNFINFMKSLKRSFRNWKFN